MNYYAPKCHSLTSLSAKVCTGIIKWFKCHPCRKWAKTMISRPLMITEQHNAVYGLCVVGPLLCSNGLCTATASEKNPLLKWGSEGSVSTNTTQCVPDVLLTHTMTDGLNNWWNKWLLCWFFIVLGFEKIKQCSSSPLPSLWDLVMMAIESWSERLPHLLIYVLMSSWHFGRVKNEPLLRLPWTNTVLHMRRPIQCWRPLVVIEE